MKGNLLKKIGAVATTVAMIASVGVTGFAATNVEYTGGASVIMGVETEAGSGIYKVDVPYESGVANTIGVTMLSYAAAGHAGFESADTAYDNTMQIVGVDQINAGDATNKIGNGETGTFTFYVDTNGTDAEGTIRMEKGERGIVLLSGDAASGANGYLFQAGRAAATVTVVNGGGESLTEINVEYPAEAQLGKDYVKEYITGDNGLSVKLINKVDASAVTVELAQGATEYDPANWKAQAVNYVVNVNDDSVDVTPATIKVNYLTKPWTANSAVTYSTLYADPTATKDDVTAMVKETLTGKTVALTDGTFTYNYALTEDEINDIEVPSGDFAEGSTYNYTLAIEGKTISADEVTIPNVTVTIPVTIQVDTRCEATSAKAFKGAAEVANTATFAMAEGDTAQKVLEYARTLADSFKLYDDDKHEVAGTATWKLYKGDAEATLTEALADAAEYTAVATVVPAEAEGTDEWKDTAATVEITITVSAKPAGTPYVFGDANMSGVEDIGDNERLDDAVDAEDWMAILFHVTGDAPINALDDPDSAQFAAANVVISGDEETVDAEDWMAILFHLTGDAENTEIGAVKVK